MEKLQQESNDRDRNSVIADQLEITFYTDPLCCWSWAWQPQFSLLQSMLGSQAAWQLKMGGLIPDWTHFHDHTSSISRPLQMGPVWMHAGQMAGRPIKHQLWLTDPPASSYPACIAVKCAGLQSAGLGMHMYTMLQTACMENGLNVAKKNVLTDIATALNEIEPGFNLSQFLQDFENGKGKNLLRIDLDETLKHNITRFPSLVVRFNKKAMVIPGYRDALGVLEAIKNIAPKVYNCMLLQR